MKPPRFWFRDPQNPGLLSTLLLPLSVVWAFKTDRRLKNGSRARVDIPVISVGNINLGGTGKTPTVIALIDQLKSMGKNPAVISRGYGGDVEGPHLVESQKDRAEQVGDEPLLISGFVPVWVAKDRLAGAEAAQEAGHDCIILDDALQNPSLYHDLSFAVVDAEIGFGNGRVCPSGPLREPVNAGLDRADLVVAIGAAAAVTKVQKIWPQLSSDKLVAAQLKPLETGFAWTSMRTYAFAGIGRPKKFFDSLRAEGAELVVARSFGDHEPYSLAVLKRMQAEAWAKDAHLVTTEKDAARLPPEMRTEVLTFPVRLHFEMPEKVQAALSALFVKRS